jgi:ATP-dependent RNA helicase DeaD
VVRYLRIEAIVSSFEELHLSPLLAGRLAEWGWNASQREARDAAATAARGNNLVIQAPPTPAWAAPALAGLLSRAESRPALLLAPDSELGEWGALAQLLARETGWRVLAPEGEARAARLLLAGQIDLLVATPAIAMALVRRSALKVSGLGALVLAGGDRLDADMLDLLLADLPADAQRIVIGSDPTRVAQLAERNARKALLVDLLSVAEPSDQPVRVATAGWDRRAEATAQILELLDPPHAVVWVASGASVPQIRRTVPELGGAVEVVTGDVPPAPVIIAYDLPTPSRLQQLRAGGDVVLLATPGSELYLPTLASVRRALRLPGFGERVRDAGDQRRRDIVRRIEGGDLERGVLVLAPLLERYDAVQVASALYELWQGAQAAARPVPGASAEPVASPQGDKARIWMGVGSRDDVTPGDLVAALVKEAGVDGSRIGKIEIRENFSLVEVPAQEAEQIAERASQLTIRRRRVSARLDRGPIPGRGRHERPDRAGRPMRPPRR